MREASATSCNHLRQALNILFAKHAGANHLSFFLLEAFKTVLLGRQASRESHNSLLRGYLFTAPGAEDLNNLILSARRFPKLQPL